jgi:hypothetical protein
LAVFRPQPEDSHIGVVLLGGQWRVLKSHSYGRDLLKILKHQQKALAQQGVIVGDQ